MDTFLNLWFFASWAQILTAKASARLKRTTRNIRDLLLKSSNRLFRQKIIADDSAIVKAKICKTYSEPLQANLRDQLN
jgi:hypothetical protein